MKTVRISSKEFERLYQRFSNHRKKRIVEKVKKIVDAVHIEGDRAVLRFTREFDKAKLSPRQIRVTEGEISVAFQDIDPKYVDYFKQVINNVTRFHQVQLRDSWRMKTEDGFNLGIDYIPIEKVGIYIPGGTASLISTVFMSVIPAKVAGVKEIYISSPPQSNGYLNPYILVVANLLKVTGVFKIGGAQAIAAFAFGTKTIPKVDKIVGPGNIYVTEAKRQVYGYVDIDSLAGPSEVVVIASRFAKAEYIISDLKAQSEHKNGLAILITPSKALANLCKKSVTNGYIIKVRNLEQAVEIANRLAPEHLELVVKAPYRLLKKVKNAGAVFLGPYSPTAVGDYIAGPSHILPTAGTSRFFSGLSVDDFMRFHSIIHCSKKALEKYKDALKILTEIEGMKEHFNSIEVRLK
jgi:histidinol dehydrogenase